MIEEGIVLLINFLGSIFSLLATLKFPGTEFSFLAIFLSFLIVQFSVKFFKWLVGFRGLQHDSEVNDNEAG